MNSFEEKQNYVTTCMQKTVDNLLEKWKQRHINREKLNEEETVKLQNQKNLREIGTKDQFSWLNVKTK